MPAARFIPDASLDEAQALNEQHVPIVTAAAQVARLIRRRFANDQEPRSAGDH